jgi:DNA repair protein RadD
VLVPNDLGLPAVATGEEARGSDQAASEIRITPTQCSPSTQVGLRQYQADVVNRIETLLGSASRPLIVAPTGSGKTIIAAEIINRVVARGGRVLVIAHRREIIRQTADKLIAASVTPGIVLAGLERELRPMAAVQVAGIQTLHARAIRSDRMPMPAATLVIVDEAHHARARTYQAVIDAYPDAPIIGLTATPVRGDGRGLGNIFTTMIEAPQIPDLIQLGHLVGTKVYAPVDKNIAKGVKTRTGDYVVSALSARMNTDQLVGDVVADWLKHGERRKTVAFACDVAHSVAIKTACLEFGVRAEHLDGSTPKHERDQILARLKSGETEVVTNCMVLTEGFDLPDLGCIILARPTKQMGLFRQMIGRGLRPAEGKSDCIILDHSGAVYRHGLPEDRVEWPLETDQRAENPTQAKRDRGDAPKLTECPQCKVLMVTPPPCVHCGWMPKPRARDRDFVDGELGLVVGGKAQASVYDENARVEFFQQLRTVQQMRGYKKGWAAHKFKEKFGTFPPWSYNDLPPLAPTDATLRWIRSRNIAWAKSQRAVA